MCLFLRIRIQRMAQAAAAQARDKAALEAMAMV
jgi:hypothetical protein